MSGLRWSEEMHAAWKAREAAREALQDQPRPKLRLTHPQPPEAAVLDAVLKVLRLHPRVGWCERMNSGAGRFVYPDGQTSQFIRFGFPGMSDVLGQLRCGRFLAVECKTRTGKPTVEQANFLNIVRHLGGVAFIARSVDDVITELGPL